MDCPAGLCRRGHPGPYLYMSQPITEELRSRLQSYVRYSMAVSGRSLTPQELLKPLSLAIRDRLVDRMLETEERYQQADSKRVYYLSMEFLMGRWLGDNIVNMELQQAAAEAIAGFGVELAEVLDVEPDAENERRSHVVRM